MSHRRSAIPSIIVAVVACLWLAPLAWLALSAFKSRADIVAMPPKLVFSPKLENFRWSYNGLNPADLAVNSLVVSGISALAVTILAVFAGDALRKARERMRRELFWLVLSTRMAPGAVLSVPLFTLLTWVDLRGTHAAVILAHCTLNLPLGIWLMWRGFARVPLRMEFAARVDGASPRVAWCTTTLPLVLPSVVATFLLSFVFSWNEYTLSSLLSSSSSRPLVTAFPTFVAQGISQWGWFSAIGAISIVPAFVLAFVLAGTLTRAVSPRSAGRGQI